MSKDFSGNRLYDAIYSASERNALERERSSQVTRQTEHERWLKDAARSGRPLRQAEKVELLRNKKRTSLRDLQEEVHARLEQKGLKGIESTDYFSKRLNDSANGDTLRADVERVLEEMLDERPSVEWRTLFEKLDRAFPNSGCLGHLEIDTQDSLGERESDIDKPNDFGMMLDALRLAITHAKRLQAGVIEGKKVAAWEWGFIEQQAVPLDFWLETRDPDEFVHVIDNVTVRNVLAWLVEKELDIPCRYRSSRKFGVKGEIDQIEDKQGPSQRLRYRDILDRK
jgi:hypothetical protein